MPRSIWSVKLFYLQSLLQVSWLDDGKIYSFLVLSSFLCNRIGMQTVILRGELICVSLFSLLLGLQPICLNSELCNFCGLKYIVFATPSQLEATTLQPNWCPRL